MRTVTPELSGSVEEAPAGWAVPNVTPEGALRREAMRVLPPRERVAVAAPAPVTVALVCARHCIGVPAETPEISSWMRIWLRPLRYRIPLRTELGDQLMSVNKVW